MQDKSYVSDERALTVLAASQGGYFTSKQAAAIGYTAPKRSYHVGAGNWVRERRGIFRFSTQPLPARPDLIIWWLWSRNRQDEPQGVYSHQTALSLHELTDVMPSRFHMTVPKTFRRSAAIPRVVILHMADVPPSDIERIDGVPVTNALRTLIDVASSGEIPLADLELAFAKAVQSGSITRRQALEERLKTISSREGTDFQRLSRQVAFDRFLARLVSASTGDWILKGGYAMELRFVTARSTRWTNLREVPYRCKHRRCDPRTRRNHDHSGLARVRGNPITFNHYDCQ